MGLGTLLLFQLETLEPRGLGPSEELLHAAQLIGGILVSLRPVYSVTYGRTPACREPLQFSASQNVLLLQVLLSPLSTLIDIS